jgi:hypothetical protein
MKIALIILAAPLIVVAYGVLGFAAGAYEGALEAIHQARAGRA